ncbi:receptor-transporting protein 3-like [Cyprinodon tularosa]|uniref:receptor-transporting protein 3-like n=1 Tax=Cyprinodon tularosa TaxID=77115 RepID=UPI0018E27EDF|nr:receptor-transporting protein 3-like [Cyprinodon tularosa]
MNKEDWSSIFDEEIAILNDKGDTWHLEFDESIEPEKPDSRWKEYIRKTSARFSCTSCTRTWPSNQVMVVFHMRLMSRQGTVKVRPLRQNCKKCKSAPMLEPLVKQDNIRVLMENLVQKVRRNCYKEDIEELNRAFEQFHVRSAHEPDHCEGCKFNVCAKE